MEQRDQKVSAPWTRAQAKLDAADDELSDACDALRSADSACTRTRFELFSATEFDLREQNRRLTAENKRLLIENERLREGQLHASVCGSDSE